MERSMAKFLLMVSGMLFLLALVIAAICWGKGGALIVTALWLIIALWLGRYMRCPNCGRGQGRAAWWAEFCPHCGEPLE